MEREFESFIREKKFVYNISNHTVSFYKDSFKALQKHSHIKTIEDLNKESLLEFVSLMRENGVSPSCTDARIRGINPFLTWLFENQLTNEHLKLRRAKLQKRVMKTFTEAQIKAFISYKPSNYFEKRLYVLLMLLLDTGVRINEALSLTREQVDFENLLIAVVGKGNKERLVPFSFELRKSLFSFMRTHKFDLVFVNRSGTKLSYNNVRRDFSRLTAKLGIEGVDGSFHAFRRCFARNFVRNGGNLFYLQKLLGHTTLKMSREYVELETEDLQKEQQRTSILNRVR